MRCPRSPTKNVWCSSAELPEPNRPCWTRRSTPLRTSTNLRSEEPSEEVIDAVSSIADEECMVQLGRIARTEPALLDAALNALEDIDQPPIGGAVRGSN